MAQRHVMPYHRATAPTRTTTRRPSHPAGSGVSYNVGETFVGTNKLAVLNALGVSFANMSVTIFAPGTTFFPGQATQGISVDTTTVYDYMSPSARAFSFADLLQIGAYGTTANLPDGFNPADLYMANRLANNGAMDSLIQPYVISRNLNSYQLTIQVLFGFRRRRARAGSGDGCKSNGARGGGGGLEGDRAWATVSGALSAPAGAATGWPHEHRQPRAPCFFTFRISGTPPNLSTPPHSQTRTAAGRTKSSKTCSTVASATMPSFSPTSSRSCPRATRARASLTSSPPNFRRARPRSSPQARALSTLRRSTASSASNRTSR